MNILGYVRVTSIIGGKTLLLYSPDTRIKMKANNRVGRIASVVIENTADSPVVRYQVEYWDEGTNNFVNNTVYECEMIVLDNKVSSSRKIGFQ